MGAEASTSDISGSRDCKRSLEAWRAFFLRGGGMPKFQSPYPLRVGLVWTRTGIGEPVSTPQATR